MGVIRFGLEEYLVKFDNGYSEELYAIQGETARSYIFTLTDMDSKVEDTSSIDLYMTLNIKNKSNIIKGIPVLEIEIEKEIEKAKKENQSSSSEQLEEIMNGIRNSEVLKEKHKGKFLVKIPQWYLHESDKNAIYQMFIVERSENALLAQKEGKFIVYPNRNYESMSIEDESVGENLLVDFHEHKMYMDKVIEIGEKYEKVYDVVSKADKIESLYEVLSSISQDDQLYQKLMTTVTEIKESQISGDARVTALETKMDNKFASFGTPLRVLERKTFSRDADGEVGEYTIYTNGYCEYHADRVISNFKILNQYGTVYQGVYKWTYPMIFERYPHVSVECAVYSTGASWGFATNSMTNVVHVRVIDSYTRNGSDTTRISIKASGFVNIDNYLNPKYAPLKELDASKEW